MKAFFFTGWVSQFQKGHFSDACSNMIFYGGEEEPSWRAFEEWLLSPNQAEVPVSTKIEKMVGSPVMEQLLTERGFVPLNWPELCEEAERILQSSEPDDLSQGYWADCNELVNSQQLSPNIEWLQRDLPADTRLDLNWSADKPHFFLLSVPGAPKNSFPNPPEPMIGSGELREEEEPEEVAESESGQRETPFPELAERELTVVIQARNAVVATWLWRKHGPEALEAAGMALRPIRIDPLCAAGPVSA